MGVLSAVRARGLAALVAASSMLGLCFASGASATPFTMTVPGTGLSVPSAYPEAGGIVIVMVGVNGQVYYQFSDPDGAFRGFNSNGEPAAFRGNPFTVNDPIPLDCGVRSCTDYFGGAIAEVYVRFSAFDGDTQPGGFDENDISLILNGVNVGSWSGLTTERTDNSGTQSFGFETGFGNQTFNTGWFSSTDPTLLNSLLTTGQTTTQVLDDDPNDNYWDFRRGESLANEDLRTIAPGYEFEKSTTATDYTQAGEVITYTYVVTNIGSVNINNLQVTDDKVNGQGGVVTCDKTTINETTGGGSAEFATCTASYTVTQADVDSGSLTNVAQATGEPEFGELGAVTDQVTLPGPTAAPDMSITKVATPQTFTAVGDVISYEYVVENTGNTTLTNLSVSDDRIATLSCSATSLLPDDQLVCSASYVVTQADLDAFLISGTPVTNEATARAEDRGGPVLTRSVTETVSGPGPNVDMVVTKSALQGSYDAVGDVIQFRIEVTNTGNVTWPGPPTVTDPFITNAGGTISCPVGPVAPLGSVTCTGDYAIQQPDIDAGSITNLATASITVAGDTASDDDDLTINADQTGGLTIVKQLNASSATSFDATGVVLKYDYILTNTGNVTISDPSVSDDRVNVTCPPGPVAPGASVTCVSDDYLTLQSDLDAGEVMNIASGSADLPGGGTVGAGPVDLTVSADQMPELTLDKQVPTVAPVDFFEGETVTYTYVVTNSGNVTLTAPVTVTDDRFPNPIDCGTAPLAPGASRSCQATYTITLADENAGFVTNNATATDGTTTSNTDTETIPQAGTDAITLDKVSLTPDVDDLSDVITYEFTVTNVGDLPINTDRTISINDPKLTNVTCDQTQRIFPVGQGTPNSVVCTGTYSPTQAELDAGQVDNSATAQFTRPNNGNPFTVVSPSAEETVPVSITPALTFDKIAPADFGVAGDVITYTFQITNDTAQTIATASVSDPLIPSLSCDFTDIAPFATVQCQGDYTVTQADVDAESITNTATATGTGSTGEAIPPQSDTETVTIDPNAAVKSLSLSKTADLADFTAVGDVITYTFAVANTGTQTLDSIVVDDPSLGFTCTIATLSPSSVDDTTCRVIYTVTQADLDAGQVDNAASASAPGAPTDNSSETVPAAGRNADFTVDKQADDATNVVAGQVITYTYTVTNTGNVTLSDVSLTDQHTGSSGTASLTISSGGNTGSLAPGASTTLSATYTVTQDDIDAGTALSNTVTGTGTPPAGMTPPTDDDLETVTTAPASPELRVEKTEVGGDGMFGAPGSTESYSFEVFNDGNVTLSGLVLTDDLTGFSCALADLAPGASTTVCANATPLADTYTVLQSDLDAKFLANTVQVTAQDPSGGAVNAQDEVTLNGPTQSPAISMVKSATSGDPYSAVGDVIDYDYVVTNDGNITLTAPITVADDRTTVTCPGMPSGGLAPGASLTCTSSYTVTQTDLDTGSVTNIATASITQPVVPDTPGGPSSVTTDSGPESETANATQNPSLDVDKVVKPGTTATYDSPGDVVTFQYTVTNTGNVTIPSPIEITDDRIASGAPQACSTASLAPGASVVCELDWTAIQQNIDDGSVTNTASPVAMFNAAPVPAGSDQATISAIQTPELSMDKQLVSIEDNTFAAGKLVTYRYVVSNVGNTTITTEPDINDNLIPAADISIDAPFPAAGILPGDTITYTGTYVLTLADIQLGSVTNNATAQTPETTSPPDSQTIPVNADPALSLVKQAQQTSFTAVGDVIDYTYTVTNTSSGTPQPAFANAITVADDKVTVNCPTPPGGQLLVGESITCTAQYTVQQSDLDAVASGQPGGFVTNVATANTSFSGQPVQSPAQTVTVPAVNNPAMDVTKSVDGGPDPAGVGDTITFGILTENTGDTTLSGITVTDPLLPVLNCFLGTDDSGPAAPANVSLAPGETLYCRGDYEITQADVDAQSLTNTATAQGSTPAGDPVTDNGSTTANLDADDPDVSVSKALAASEPDGAYSVVGQVLEFAVTVENTGNVTLTSTTVTDDLLPGESCAIGSLAPGDVDTSCSFFYTVTQEDVDNGELTNTATAESVPASDPSNPVSGDGEVTIDGPDAEPSFGLVKDADISQFGSDGVTITYSYTVANTGNVTLTAAPTVSDDKIASVSCPSYPSGGLRPGEFITCTGTYVTTQADVDAGGVTNVASVSSADKPFDPANPDGAQATETVPATQGPAFTISKTADDTTDVVVGQQITYAYRVENTGNVTLTNITLTDQHTSASGTSALSLTNGGVIASLAPGAFTVLEATYTVTQDDIDAGNDLTNTVNGTATPPSGLTPPTASDDETVTVASPDPALTVVKTVASSSGSDAGDTVTFEITVENTGNVTLGSISLTDTLRNGTGSAITPSPAPTLVSGDGVELSVGEIWTYAVSYTLTQADVDSGGLSNSARATGTDPFGSLVSDLSDNGVPTDGNDNPTPFVIPADPSLDAQKIITSTGTDVGDTVTFRITLENTGNVTLTSVSILSDTLERLDGTALSLDSGPTFVGADGGSGDGTLRVDETATYVASYVLTQADIDAGGIQNQAVGQGSPPSGPPVTDTSDNGTPGDGTDDPTTLPIVAAPAISFDKFYSGANPTFDAVGDVLDYTFRLVNTGNVTLTDAITVTDPLIANSGGAITCDPVSTSAPWAPGDTRECTGSYTVTQADLDAGEVLNSATADVGDAPTKSDDERVPANQNPAMMLDKVADSVDPATEFFVGAVIGYTYTVTNTGNVTLFDPITISDNLIPASDISCPAYPAGGVAPGDTYTCRGEYTVTSGDVDFTTVTNLASATDGTTTSPLTSETIPNNAVPALTVTKETLRVTDSSGTDRSPAAFEAVGDLVFYSFELENSGDLAFVNDIEIVDARLGAPLVCFTPTSGDPDFRPGETITCETTASEAYVVTQADLDAGEIFNEAVAETMVSGLTTPIVSAPSSTTTPSNLSPMFAIAKTVAPSSYGNLGDTLTFGFEITNTGNQTLNDVEVSDALLPGLTCSTASLAPGDTLTCSAPYSVTQEDIDTGEVENTAFANGITPQGTAVPEESDTATATGPVSDPLSLSLTKSATPDPFGGVGSTLTYGFEVMNTSKFTLFDITISDPLLPGFSCVISELAPGDTDALSCFAPYTVTQDDVDAGEIINTASATARDLNNTRTITVDDDLTTPSGPRSPALEVTKTAVISVLAPGELITFELAVVNTGDVSLDITGISDTMSRLQTGAPTFLTTPFSFVTGDSDNDTLLDVDEVWTYTATYEITQSDLNAGGIQNSVTITADGPTNSGSTSDISDDGNDGDGNSVDDPTVVEITRDPMLDVEKTVLTTGSQVGDTVIFEITARNIGNVDITGLGVTDTLSRADGTLVGTMTATPIGVVPDPFSPGASFVWQLSHVLTTHDIDAGGLSNVADVSGQGPTGDTVVDRSDDGNNSDGNTVDDPTELMIDPAPELIVTKTSPAQTTPPSAAGDIVSFEILIENTGNVTLSNVIVDDQLSRADGTVLVPDSVTPANGFALAAGDSETIFVDYVLVQDDVDAGGIQNVAVVTGTTPLGLPSTDTSDDGDDTDGNTINDPTEIVIPADTALTLVKEAGTPTRVNGSIFEVIFTITAENQGNVTHKSIVMEDDMTAFVAPATLTNVAVPVVSGFQAGTANTAYNGTSDISLLAPGAELAPGETGTVLIAVQYDIADGSPEGQNTVSFTSDRTDAPITDSTGVAASEETADIVATKRVISTGLVLRGSTVRYEITFQNNNTTAEGGLTFVDRLPSGMIYTPDSATFDGAATPQPVVTGNTLTWPNQTLAPGQIVTIQISARLLDGAGEYTNSAWVQSAGGSRVSNIATATVRVAPEAVFDCGDVIGRVFDDIDNDGYQDPPADLAGITNQDIFNDKLGKLAPAEVEAQGGEPGLPGVKLVTPRGDIITTDEHGRYSVPCALLPARIGSNFLLKLDERTLPTGYRVTTENPRVMRLTPGKMAEMNFGAALGNLVEIDLTAAAFAGTEPSGALVAGLKALAAQMSVEPSAVLLRYYRGDEGVPLARARLKAAEQALRDAWRGGYRLDVERSVRRLQ